MPEEKIAILGKAVIKILNDLLGCLRIEVDDDISAKEDIDILHLFLQARICSQVVIFKLDQAL